MKYKVFFRGGYFDGTMYGVIEQVFLPEEIFMHHYENPQAKMQGITILGITQKGPDDITVVERYVMTENQGLVGGETEGVAWYEFASTVDPSKIVRVETLDGDYVLKMRHDLPENDDDEGPS